MEFIHRQQPTTDESPPWAGIIFKLPVDSDALSERLKTAYPDCRTHRERKHRAAIDFLTDELQRMQSKSSADFAASEGRQDEQKAYIDILSDRSRPQSASSCTSPSGPGSIYSPGIMERARPSPGRSTSSAPLQSSTPTTNPQQFVWSAHDGRSMRPKTKRKMTSEERSAYKETRKRGACDKCRKQKGRCTHVIEGDPLSVMAEQASKPPKRRGSAGLDLDQPEGLKSMKTEHASDVHHLVSEAPNPFQPSLPRQQSLHERRNEPAESAAEATSGHQQWEGGPGAGVLPEDSSSVSPPSDRDGSRSSSTKSPTPTNNYTPAPVATPVAAPTPTPTTEVIPAEAMRV